jgi:hypothetical protein
MHLLYCDESGHPNDPNQRHFVLAGVCFFERQTYWISSELDKIASKINPADPKSIEFHGSPMFSGRGVWRKYPKTERLQLIKDCLSILTTSHKDNIIFACIVNKSVISPKDPVEYCFEQLSSRFDHFLQRKHRANNTQRGVIIFDKSTYESTIQNLAIDFRTIGHTWGVLNNLAEVPLFLDLKASRLIQLADLIAWSVFRNYESADDQFLSIIKPRFDIAGGITHGLYESL